MKRQMINLAVILLCFCLLAGCGSQQPSDESSTVSSYQQISQEEAKEMMARDDGHIIVDVRRQDEYETGHIPGAILIPNESITNERPTKLPDIDQIILIYCRSGNRSKQASQKLADMGYTNVYEFGGINTWTGEIATGESEEPLQKDPSDSSSGVEPIEPVSEMRITITAGEHVISAVLYDNAAGQALWDKLPLTLPMMNLYGREMCYRFGAGSLPDDDAADTGYQIGDISYWPPAGSLVILYKQNGEVFEQQPIGHTDDDISFFDGMPDTEITFEKPAATDESEQDGFEQDSPVLVIEANGHTFYADFEDNSSAEALKEQLGSSVIELNLQDYGNFEKVGSLPWTLPRNDTSITTVPGDVILYQGKQITIYYDENTWNFTRLAKIRDVTKADLLEAFGSGDVTVKFWVE